MTDTLREAVKRYPNDADLGEAIRKGDVLNPFETYTDFVRSLKVYPEKHAIVYPALGLAGEAGEYCEKVKKWLRGDGDLDKELCKKELGDILFYITSSADDLGFSLHEVALANVEKLKSRKERGVLKGSGDER